MLSYSWAWIRQNKYIVIITMKESTNIVNFMTPGIGVARHSWPLSSEGFFPLRHGPTVYNNHLRGPVTLTRVAERLAVELSLPVFTTWVFRDRGSNPDLPHSRRTLYFYVIAAVHD